jgi:hypothetical protein
LKLALNLVAWASSTQVSPLDLTHLNNATNRQQIDNINRANRVTQLADNIGAFQQLIQETADDIQFNDERAAKVLDTIWKNAGYKTLDEYIEAALAQLSAEDRKRYLDMKRELEARDQVVDASFKVGSGLLAVSVFAGLTRNMSSCFQESASLI